MKRTVTDTQRSAGNRRSRLGYAMVARKNQTLLVAAPVAQLGESGGLLSRKSWFESRQGYFFGPERRLEEILRRRLRLTDQAPKSPFLHDFYERGDCA